MFSIFNMQSDKTNKYLMSFTTGGLFLRESVDTARLFLQTGDWDLVVKKMIDENLLQARTMSTAKRICREIISRLKQLNQKELDLLLDGKIQEQKYLLWIAICRRYRFIAEFAVEIIREHFMALRDRLSTADFDSFLDGKTALNPELERIKPSTRKKLRQVLFRILREADLLSRENLIIPVMFPPSLQEAISPEDIMFFPVVAPNFTEDNP